MLATYRVLLRLLRRSYVHTHSASVFFQPAGALETTSARISVARAGRKRKKMHEWKTKDDEENERKKERKRRRKWKSKSRKASERAAASPWRGIYDVISSLTVNNFPRGCGRHRAFARAATTVPPSRRTSRRVSPRIFPSRLSPATVSLSSYLGSPLPPFSSLCKLKRRRRAS